MLGIRVGELQPDDAAEGLTDKHDLLDAQMIYEAAHVSGERVEQRFVTSLGDGRAPHAAHVRS
jgi:hypothetical protein